MLLSYGVVCNYIYVHNAVKVSSRGYYGVLGQSVRTGVYGRDITHEKSRGIAASLAGGQNCVSGEYFVTVSKVLKL